jgi:RNA polymerase sigma-B factor
VHATRNEEERALFARLRAHPTPEDREAAVERYLPLAHALAARYAHSSEPMEDLQQVAAVGLLNAIDRFDPDRGTAFSSFAVPTILGELRRHFRDRTWPVRVPRALQELTLRIEHARDELVVSLGRQPTIGELAHDLGVSEELVLQALDVALARSAFPLDGPSDEDSEPEGVPAPLDDGFDRAEDRAMLAPLLRVLSARDAQIVFLRFHADLTQESIARRVGLSQMHVSRVLYRSVARLRATVLAMDLEERTLDDTISRECAVCGARLTTQEIQAAREAGGPFLCTVHAVEEAPADELLDEDLGET